MANITPTVTRVGNNSVLVTWTPVTEADACLPAPEWCSEFADRSVQAAGTFGGASVAVHGSNDGTNYAALNSPANTAIAITSLGIKAVLEGTRFVKPVATGGTSQTLTITMFGRRGRGGREQ